MTIIETPPTCILTAENMATEDDCSTHDHELPSTAIVVDGRVVDWKDPAKRGRECISCGARTRDGVLEHRYFCRATPA